MSFTDWLQENHPAWYLNSLKQEAELFEEYMDYRKKEKANQDGSLERQ